MKINDQIFLKIQKPYFWHISPILGAKVFPKSPALSHTTC